MLNKKKKILAVVLAVVLLAVGFGIGFLTRGYTSGSAAFTYEWVVNTIKNNYYYEVDEDDINKSALGALGGGVLDIYSGFFTAEEYAEQMSGNAGNKSGIGFSYEYVDNDIVGTGAYINYVVGNSPAYKRGLKAGMLITSLTVGGEDKTFSSVNELSDILTAVPTGEEIDIVADGNTYTVAKSEYIASYCSMTLNDKAYDCVYADGKLTVKQVASRAEYLPDGAAYFRLDQFFGNAVSEAGALMEVFNAEHCTSLILDLRGNGGGYVEVMQQLAHVFAGSRVGVSDIAMTARYKNGYEQSFPVKRTLSGNKLLPADAKVYVLADTGSASASEALLGYLVSENAVKCQDIYLSDFSDEYVKTHISNGEKKDMRTYGKGIMQQYFRNPATGDALKLTTAQLYWPNGKTIHGVGLTPADGCKTLPAEWRFYTSEGRDAVLDRAVKLLYGN